MTTTQTRTVLRHIRGMVTAEYTTQMPDSELLERFAAGREEQAFAVLVRRHGPMVLGVCRRLLHNWHDAEDAFQATFLALWRKAGTVGKSGSVGGWLHRVAYHAALKAKARVSHGAMQECPVEQQLAADPLAEVTGRELLAVLDEELHKLPERLRVPLVLCYLEGKTRDEAARELGWSLGSLKRRLEEGRASLHARVAGRGISLGVLLAAGVGAAAVPAALAAGVTKVATGQAAASAAVAALAAGLIPGVVVGKLKLAVTLLLLCGLVAAAGVLCGRPPAAAEETKPPAAAPPEKNPAPPVKEEKAEMTVSGRVAGSDGKPVAGATVVVVARTRQQFRSGDPVADRVHLLGEGKTDADGRFRFTAERTSSARHQDVYAVAGAEDHALAWQRLGPDVERPEVALTLPPEKVVRGRLLNLQGEPAAGVSVSVSWVGSEVNGEFHGISLAGLPKKLGLWPGPTTTDEKGRFEVRGLNRDQSILLKVSDDRFALQSFEITPVGKPRPERRTLALDAGGNIAEHHQLADEKGQPEEPTFTLAPARVIEGRVVAADTGNPIARARVEGVETDKEGRFRFRVSGTSSGVTLMAVAPAGEPYLSVFHRVEWPKGTVKQEVKIELPRGVLVRGKVMEKDSGKPVAGACVQFWPRQIDNPNLRKNVVTGWQRRELTAADGSFAIAVLPGPGHLLFQGPTPDYVHDEGITGEMIYAGRPGGSRYYPDAAVKLDVPAKGDVKEVAVTLRRGVTVRGKLLDPDGKPVARAIMLHRLHVSHDLGWHFPTEARDGVFEVHGLDPEKEVPVYFLDAERQCGAAVTLSGKQAGKDVTVRLAPCGKAMARYVDGKGQPLIGYQASPDIVVTPGRWGQYGVRDGKAEDAVADEASLTNIDRHNYWDRVKTDDKGRITFPALVPGVTYRIARWEKDTWVLHKEFTVESGKTLDLGDVPVNKNE